MQFLSVESKGYIYVKKKVLQSTPKAWQWIQNILWGKRLTTRTVMHHPFLELQTMTFIYLVVSTGAIAVSY